MKINNYAFLSHTFSNYNIAFLFQAKNTSSQDCSSLPSAIYHRVTFTVHNVLTVLPFKPGVTEVKRLSRSVKLGIFQNYTLCLRGIVASAVNLPLLLCWGIQYATCMCSLAKRK